MYVRSWQRTDVECVVILCMLVWVFLWDNSSCMNCWVKLLLSSELPHLCPQRSRSLGRRWSEKPLHGMQNQLAICSQCCLMAMPTVSQTAFPKILTWHLYIYADVSSETFQTFLESWRQIVPELDAQQKSLQADLLKKQPAEVSFCSFCCLSHDGHMTCFVFPLLFFLQRVLAVSSNLRTHISTHCQVVLTTYRSESIALPFLLSSLFLCECIHFSSWRSGCWSWPMSAYGHTRLPTCETPSTSANAMYLPSVDWAPRSSALSRTATRSPRRMTELGCLRGDVYGDPSHTLALSITNHYRTSGIVWSRRLSLDGR